MKIAESFLNKILWIIIITSIIFSGLYVYNLKNTNKEQLQYIAELEKVINTPVDTSNVEVIYDSTLIFEAKETIVNLTNLLNNKDLIIESLRKQLEEEEEEDNDNGNNEDSTEIVLFDSTKVDTFKIDKMILADSVNIKFDAITKINFKIKLFEETNNIYLTNQNDLIIQKIKLDYKPKIVTKYIKVNNNQKSKFKLFVSGTIGTLNSTTKINDAEESFVNNSILVGPSIGINAIFNSKYFVGLKFGNDTIFIDFGYSVFTIWD